MQPHVIIDPGHGGSVAYGGSSPLGVEPQVGVSEKQVNLELARRVAARLGELAVLTRESDINVPLRERAQLAARTGARVLVSIHANAGAYGTRGSEVWLHERHDSRSAELAASIHADLDRVGPTRGIFRGPLALLEPEATGSVAACLVEADYLSDAQGRERLTSERGLDQLADAICKGVRGYLGRDDAARNDAARSDAARNDGTWRAPVSSRDYDSYEGYGDGDGDGGYFTDTAELDRYMRDQRAADELRVSRVADAQALVDAYTARRSPSVWTGINAVEAAAQIRARCANHRLFQQGNLNLCGPASFLSMWAGRDPVGYARYALGLLESGTGSIGSHAVTASASLRALSYPRLRNPNTTMTAPAADFIAMASLRNDANAILPYDGRRSMEQLAGLTRPEELAEWLGWTGVYSRVRQEANWARLAGYEHATRLLPGSGTDIALLIHVNALANARAVQALDVPPNGNPVTPDHTFLLSQFPNHYVMLISEVVPASDGRSFRMSIWTWGGSYVFGEVPWRDFVDNYYGAVTAYVRR